MILYSSYTEDKMNEVKMFFEKGTFEHDGQTYPLSFKKMEEFEVFSLVSGDPKTRELYNVHVILEKDEENILKSIEQILNLKEEKFALSYCETVKEIVMNALKDSGHELVEMKQ